MKTTAKILLSTAVLTVLGASVTGIASARINGSRANDSVSGVVTTRPRHDAGEGRDRGHDRRGKKGPHLEAAATALGMTPEELRTALQSGSTLADIAVSKKIDVQNVIDAVIADEKSEITAAVAAGRMTQAEADALLSKVVEHATAIVNGERPPRPFGPGPRGERRGHHDGNDDDHRDGLDQDHHSDDERSTTDQDSDA